MAILSRAKHAHLFGNNPPKEKESKVKHALHDLKDFVFSPTGLIFTIGLILLVHWYSTKEHKKG